MPAHPTNSTELSTQPSRPLKWDFEKLQQDLKDPLWQRVLGALQQRVQAHILKLVAQSNLDPRVRDTELGKYSGQNEILTAILSGSIEAFAKDVLGLNLEETAGFEPYMKLDED